MLREEIASLDAATAAAPLDAAIDRHPELRIAAPMLGGMISAPILSMLVVPAAYLLVRRRKER